MPNFLRKISLYSILCLLVLTLSGCTLYRLDIQTQYLSRDRLASYHVSTPDPRLLNPVIGQRLVVQWSLKSEEIEGQEVFLYLKVRLRNRQEEESVVPITSKRGNYLYYLVNDSYLESGGILAYFAEIRSGDSTLVSWKHPFWVDPITFDYQERIQETDILLDKNGGEKP